MVDASNLNMGSRTQLRTPMAPPIGDLPLRLRSCFGYPRSERLTSAVKMTVPAASNNRTTVEKSVKNIWGKLNMEHIFFKIES